MLFFTPTIECIINIFSWLLWFENKPLLGIRFFSSNHWSL